MHARFTWTPDLQKELDQLKLAIKNHVLLSPLDTNKPIHLHLDAATTVGMGYVLCQPRSDDPADGKTIVSCNSTTFTETQQRYSPFEAETLAVQWATKAEDYYIRAAEKVEVYSDAKGMAGLFDQELGNIPNDRLRGMLEKCLPYNLSFHHIKGSDNSVADFGSRYPRSVEDGEEFPIWKPSIQHKSRRVMEKYFDTRDPQVEKLAEI